ncbi:hypothetical protein TRVA0_014S00716 [Trichomonascus vanleenenianus]|uniref:Vam7p n=1 Tax=Trichomonascus vanleenenianus TaxID=2268995 RepID=UPI003ECAA9BA
MLSIAVPGYSETTPTVYNVQVSVDRTTYQVRKRYSEFAEFAARIEQELGDRAPGELPAKKWLGNRGREFLESRRRGLELYLRALARRDDWRDSLAFQQFLEVPQHVRPTASGASAKWLAGVTEARGLVSQATRASTGSEQRRYVVLAGAKIRDLEAVLAGDDALGDGEYRRRRDALQELTRTLLSLRDSPQQRRSGNGGNEDGAAPEPRAAETPRLSSGDDSNKPRVLGRPQETDRTRPLGNEELVQLQKDDMAEQDRLVEYLRHTIRRQKDLGEQINEELSLQNTMLDELDNETHAMSSRLNQARRRVNKLL